MSNRYARRPSPSPGDNPRGGRPPSPANDNRPPVRPPPPANDNFPRPRMTRPPLRVVPPSSALTRAMMRRALLRLVPIVGWAAMAWDFYQLWLWLRPYMGDMYWHGPRGYRRRDDLECTPPSPHQYVSRTRFSSQINLCGTAGMVATIPPAADFTGAQIYEWWTVAPGRSLGRVNMSRVRWDKLPTGPYGPPWWVIPAPDIEPPVIPIIDPFFPPGRPVLDPPIQPPIRRPRPRPRPRPGTDPWVDPFNPPNRPPPETSDGGEPSGDPGGRPTPRPRRPPPGRRERKVRMRYTDARRFLGWLLSTYSEAMDFMESMYDALHEDYKLSGNPTQAEKLAQLWKYGEHVNMAEAITNYIQNDQEDRISGRAFGRLTEVLEGYGIQLPTLRL